jgi:hypothetical protein
MPVEVTGAVKNCFLSPASSRVYSVRGRHRNESARIWMEMAPRNKVPYGGQQA